MQVLASQSKLILVMKGVVCKVKIKISFHIVLVGFEISHLCHVLLYSTYYNGSLVSCMGFIPKKDVYS